MIFFKKASPIIKVHQTFYVYLYENKKAFYQLFGIILLLALSNTLMIWLLGQPFGLLASGDYSGLAGLLLSLLGVVIINQVLHYLNTYRANVLGLLYVGRLRTFIMSQLMASPRVVTDNVAKGDLLSRLSHDVDTIERFVVELPLFLASHIFTIILYSAMLIFIDWQLALVALFLTPAFFIHQKFFTKKKRRAAQEFFKKNGRLLAKEDEMLGNVRLINTFNSQTIHEEQHKSAFSDAFFWAKKERKLDAIFTSSLSIVIYFCALFIVYQGVDKVESGELSIAELVSFLLYMGYMSVPLRGVVQLIFQAQSDAMAGERLKPYLHLHSSSSDQPSGDNKLQVTRGDIAFENISLAWGDKNIFKKMSFRIEAGKTVAIVGGSGVGKSTLANLLLCFIQPNTGRIVIDDQDLSQCSKTSVRDNIGMVWQSPMLFNDTIKNNLLLANNNATKEMIDEALKNSDADNFVSALENGVDTLIGVGGVLLSAGQKQRLHIAQVLLRDPSILIMDEATSALDSASEKILVNNIHHIRKGKTTLLIAHRHSSLRYVDYVIYLNADGSVVNGTHEELLNSHAGYKQAINWQAVNNESSE